MASFESIQRLLSHTAAVTASRRRATAAALMSATLIGLAITVAATDVVLPLSDGTRQHLFRWWPIIPAMAGVWLAWRWSQAAPRDAAALRLAEAAFADHERRLTVATQLAAMPGPLAAHASEAIAATFPLTELPKRLPASTWRRWLMVAVSSIALIVVVAVVLPDLARTVWLRLSDPSGDHPPWSRVRLDWTVAPERVRSGATVHVELAVVGEAAGTPVLYGGLSPVTMFPLGAGHWAGELSGITEPVVLWASVGGTRTLRHTVSIDPVPQLMALTLTMEAPPWSHLTPETLVWKPGVIDTVSALSGTRLVLRPTSNRPLAAVVVQIGDHSVRLDMDHGAVALPAVPGPLSLSLVAQDGVTADPLAVGIITERPDAPPRIAMPRPGHDMLATADRTVTVEFTAEDDLGLVEVVDISAVNGREAPPRRSVLTGKRTWQRTRTLDLAALGARPGDVFALGALVRDSNPQVIDGEHGQPSPFVSRTIRVISDEDYNQQIRKRLPPDALQRKYGDLLKKLQELEKEAAELHDAKADTPDLDRRLAELGRKAAALAADVRSLHRDQPLFAIEQDLQKAMTEATDALAQAAKKGDRKQLPKRQRGANLQRDLAHLTDLARAHGLAARLAQLADAEQNTTKRLAPLADHRHVGDADRVRLRELAGNEDDLAAAVDAWPGLAAEVAAQLGAVDPEVADELSDLAKRLTDSGVGDLKRQAAAACRAGDGATALRLAADARDRLLALLPRISRCQGACRGGAGLKFSWCRGNNASDAMGLGFGVGEGGWGAGGAGSGGLGLMLGYGGDDSGASWMQEGLDLNGPEALGDLGGRTGDRDGAGIADQAAGGDGRTSTSAASYQRGVRATTTTTRVRLDAGEERLIGDYLRRLTAGAADEKAPHGK